MKRCLCSLILFLTLISHAWAVDFTVTDIDGKPHQSADYKGSWLLVNFWQPGGKSPANLSEVPDIVAVDNKTYPLSIIGIALNYKDEAEVRRIIEKKQITVPIVLATDEVTKQFDSIDKLPTSLLYNPDGLLVKIHRGKITMEMIAKMVEGKPLD